MTPLKLRKLEAEGKIPGPATRKALEWAFRQIQDKSRPRYLVRRSATTIRAWAVNSAYDYLLGMNERLNETLLAVDLQSNSCYNANIVKVDHKKNVWIACQVITDSSPNYFGGEQEYSSTGTLKQSYAYNGSAFCQPGYWTCEMYGFDGGPDNSGHVFAEVSYGFGQVSGNNPQEFYTPAGFYWWNASDPSGSPTFIPVNSSSNCSAQPPSPICEVYYMDTDRSGNIWFTFFGYNEGLGGYGLGEVTNPTTSPAVNVIFPAGTYGYPGGVYVSGQGTVLNVTDGSTRETYQYYLPVTTSSVSFNTLGPTATNAEGMGEPISGGFNKAETSMVIGDAYGWYNVGALPANTWTIVPTANCRYGCSSAAYTPSDK